MGWFRRAPVEPRRELVRLQLMKPGIPDVPSVEGILIGHHGGHYHLLLGKLVQEDGTRVIDGIRTEVPEGQVVLIQVLEAVES